MQGLTLIVLERTCPYCHALRNVWCHSPKSGKRARFLHAARGDQVYAAWQFGYREGVKDGVVQTLEEASETLRRSRWFELATWFGKRAKEAAQVDPHG